MPGCSNDKSKKNDIRFIQNFMRWKYWKEVMQK